MKRNGVEITEKAVDNNKDSLDDLKGSFGRLQTGLVKRSYAKTYKLYPCYSSAIHKFRSFKIKTNN